MRKLVLFIAFLIPVLLVGIGSFAEQVEVVTASQTLAVDEFEKTFAVTGSGITITLMKAEGTRGRVTCTSVGADAFNIDPQDIDQIQFTTCAAGDQLTSPGDTTATGACITLIDYAPGLWAVVSSNATFVDGN